MRHLEELFYDPNWSPPEVIYGNNLIPEVTKRGKYAVATMEIPWNLVKEDVVTVPQKVVFVASMDSETVESLEKEIPPVEFVIGLGGGSSHDMAKYIALKRQIPLIQIPTIIASDALVTNAIGIRKNGKVKYIGHVHINEIIIDFSILNRAPKELIKYGAGDILSSYTAIFDWKLACQRGKERFYQEEYEEATKILAELEDNRFDLRDVTEKGIRTIVKLYLRYAQIANRIRTDRAQEGSEHFFAYNCEYVTKRTFVHGKLLALGIEVSSYIQENGFGKVMKLMGDLGIKISPPDVKINREEFSLVLTSLKDFVEKTPYYYSILNEVEISPSFADSLYRSICRRV